ncbi:hypothetical protein OF83DRAFT_842753 [Amylostereum chailletii]|nr:hypothetical protein OF83DRAFT_842753 [Amylostereum chailletii]
MLKSDCEALQLGAVGWGRREQHHQATPATFGLVPHSILSFSDVIPPIRPPSSLSSSQFCQLNSNHSLHIPPGPPHPLPGTLYLYTIPPACPSRRPCSTKGTFHRLSRTRVRVRCRPLASPQPGAAHGGHAHPYFGRVSPTRGRSRSFGTRFTSPEMGATVRATVRFHLLPDSMSGPQFIPQVHALSQGLNAAGVAYFNSERDVGAGVPVATATATASGSISETGRTGASIYLCLGGLRL